MVASDETGVRIEGTNSYQWVFRCAEEVVHHAAPTRGACVVHEIMDGHRPAVWLSDRYSAQQGDADRQQTCLAHLARDVAYALDAGNDTLALRLKLWLDAAFTLARTITTAARSTVNTKRRKLERSLDVILAAPAVCDLARDIQSRMRRAPDQLLTFTPFPGRVEAHNNACERDLSGIEPPPPCDATCFHPRLWPLRIHKGVSRSGAGTQGDTVADWLVAHPGIEIVCRDRGSGFREGAAKGAPQVLQICDRWHLLENATAAFVEAVKRHMGDLRRAITGGNIDPEVLSSAEKVQWAGWKRRDEVNANVRCLKSQGHSIKGIVRTTGVSRQTVRRILARTRDDVFRSRSTSLDQWSDKLCTEWDGGCRNSAELWRRLRDAGYAGSERVVREWATRRRRAAKAFADRPVLFTSVPPARTIAKLLTSERDCRSAEALRVRVAVETTVASRSVLEFGDAGRSGMMVARQAASATGW